MKGEIKIYYSSIDRCYRSGTFKTVAGARRFAQKWVGETPEVGHGYAVSADGIGKITWFGTVPEALFPALYGMPYSESD